MDQPSHIVVDNSMRQPWVYFCYRFDVSVVNLLTQSITYVGCNLLFIDDYKVYRDSVFADDLLYFCYQFDASVANSLTLSIPYVRCHSVFSDDFKAYSDPLFADDLWISRQIAFLTIPCFSHESIFAVDLMPLSWIHWRCRLHTSAVTQYSLMISRSTVTVFADDLWIICHITFLTIPCVSHESIFAIDSMCRLWIHWSCQLHASAVTHRSLTITRSIVTLFSLSIYGSART
jgi:hypothetical protein